MRTGRTRRVLLVGAVMVSMGGGLGCVNGSVNDATSRNGLDGVTVTATGACNGTGCVSSTTGQATSAAGVWYFDAYGDAAGASDVQLVTPASGQEALSLSFSLAGYKSAVVAHRPNYKTVTFGTKSYKASATQSIYLCTTGAPDADGDGLCDDAEAAYGTDPNNKDTDGDGFSDAAEVLGMTVAGSPVDLRYFGASPLHKDVFVYLDYYTMPFAAGLTQITDAFANAPNANPDGTTGVNLHIVMGKQIASADQVANIIGPSSGDWSVVDPIKTKYFPARYAPIMHYVLFANQYDSGTSSGISRGIPAHDLLVTLGAWSTPFGTQLQQAGTIMHELGHNLGLQHGGNEGRNFKPNYLSLMNYRYQVVGLFKNGVDGVLDYSRLQIGTVTENALVENNGMPAVSPTTSTLLSQYGAKFTTGLVNGTVNGPLDFNANGIYNTTTVTVDLDGNGSTADSFNPSQNDWNALVFTGSSSGGGSIGGGITAPIAAGLPVPQIVAPDHMEPELDHP
jgi:Bacterial TSP3 repeat